MTKKLIYQTTQEEIELVGGNEAEQHFSTALYDTDIHRDICYQCSVCINTVQSAVSFISLFTNQSPCGPCGCAAADPAEGASNGLKSLWGCCKQNHITISVCCCTGTTKLD